MGYSLPYSHWIKEKDELKIFTGIDNLTNAFSDKPATTNHLLPIIIYMTKTIEPIKWQVVPGIVFTDKVLQDNIEKDMEQNLTMGINFTAHFILSNQILTNGMKVKLPVNDKTQNSNGSNK
nr:2169_t:CDS:2 [Entrophospora candida]